MAPVNESEFLASLLPSDSDDDFYDHTTPDVNQNQKMQTDESDSDSDIDFDTSYSPEELKSEAYFLDKLSEVALDYYMANNGPGESYEFVNVLSGAWYIVYPGTMHTIQFSAKYLNDDRTPQHTFSATLSYPFILDLDTLRVQSFEPVDGTPDESWNHLVDDQKSDGQFAEIPMKWFYGHDAKVIPALINMGLDTYNEKHPEECYKFESYLKLGSKHKLLTSEYSCLFYAKNVNAEEENSLAAFLVTGDLVTRSIETISCDLESTNPTKLCKLG